MCFSNCPPSEATFHLHRKDFMGMLDKYLIIYESLEIKLTILHIIFAQSVIIVQVLCMVNKNVLNMENMLRRIEFDIAVY